MVLHVGWGQRPTAYPCAPLRPLEGSRGFCFLSVSARADVKRGEVKHTHSRGHFGFSKQ